MVVVVVVVSISVVNETQFLFQYFRVYGLLNDSLRYQHGGFKVFSYFDPLGTGIHRPAHTTRSVLCSPDNRGGMKRRDKEIRKQPPSSGENPGILL